MYIKPIETFYNGYKFRSRLEARWAVFFDALDVCYEYEPEGFELPMSGCYLPDFRVKCYGTRGDCPYTAWSPCIHCMHRIKDGNYQTASWFDYFCEFAKESDYENPPDFIEIIDKTSDIIDCRRKKYPEPFDLYIEVKGSMTQKDAEKIKEFSEKYPILIVGNIPPLDCSTDSCKLGAYDRMNGIDIYPFNYELIDGDHFGAYPASDDSGHFYLFGDDSSYINYGDRKRVEEAYTIARQARFEHGEKPITQYKRR